MCAGELLDASGGRTEFDAAIDYAQHIPVRVIIGMLGFPQEDSDIFRRFVHQVLEDVDMSLEERQEVIAAGEIDAYMDERIAEHRASAARRPDVVICSTQSSAARSWPRSTCAAPCCC